MNTIYIHEASDPYYDTLNEVDRCEYCGSEKVFYAKGNKVCRDCWNKGKTLKNTKQIKAVTL